jgi:hypothetical protein
MSRDAKMGVIIDFPTSGRKAGPSVDDADVTADDIEEWCRTFARSPYALCRLREIAAAAHDPDLRKFYHAVIRRANDIRAGMPKCIRVRRR